jgi:cold-inducible RNA-binding protein
MSLRAFRPRPHWVHLALGGFMGKKLYVGNLPFSATDQTLMDTFSQCGTVESAKIIMDRDSGRSKGFGFVEMSSDSEAEEAVTKLNNFEVDGRRMNVSEARPMAPRQGGGGGGGRFQNSGRGGGGGFGGGRGNRY